LLVTTDLEVVLGGSLAVENALIKTKSTPKRSPSLLDLDSNATLPKAMQTLRTFILVTFLSGNPHVSIKMKTGVVEIMGLRFQRLGRFPLR
jgi:hypothetical protein